MNPKHLVINENDVMIGVLVWIVVTLLVIAVLCWVVVQVVRLKRRVYDPYDPYRAPDRDLTG